MNESYGHEVLTAAELNGRHIGEDVRFEWCFPVTRVEATVTGELREIHHDASGVTLMVSGRNSLSGEKAEFILEDDDEVLILN